MKNKQTCILVLGMHRSGTSAFTGILSILGISLGKNLLEKQEDNQKGFFENKKIFEFHDYELLPALNSSWDDTNYLQQDWHKQDFLNDLYTKAKNLILSEYSQSDIFSIKDPRICFLFPFWEKVLLELGIGIKVIIPLRDPLEVSASLYKRNGFAEEKSLTLWAKHVMYAEYYSRAYERVLIDYAQLLSTPLVCIEKMKTMLHIGELLKDGKSIEQELNLFLDKGLRHNASKQTKLENTPKFVNDIFTHIYNLEIDETDVMKIFDNAKDSYEKSCDFLIGLDNKNITEKLSQINDLTLQVQHRDKEIQKRDKTIQQRDEIIAHKIEENNKRDKEIQKRDKTIQQRDEIIARKIEENNKRDKIIQNKIYELEDSHKENQQKDLLIQEVNNQLFEIFNSNSMRITKPLRDFVLLAKTLKNFRKSNLYNHGSNEHRLMLAIKKRIPQKLFLFIKQRVKKTPLLKKEQMPWSKDLTAISKNLGNRVLIIAELSLPQCKKYRVEQKVEMLEYLGYDVSVVSWNDSVLCRQFLQLHSLVIFYRVPAFDSVLEMLKEVKRLKIVSFFDVDDLIFDKELMLQNKNINSLGNKELKEILYGADLYKAVLSSVDHIISSTQTLGKEMQKHNGGDLYVVKNAIDKQLYDFATKYIVKKSSTDEVKIVYGSGTSTHDEDFLEVSDALVKILKKYTSVKLYIHGILNLPKSFKRFKAQVIKVPFSNADEYYRALSSYDINLAPLELSIFNDAKSNIKFLEASIFKTPTVASKVVEFTSVIESGENGFLADGTDEWFNALENLVLSKDLRIKMGEKAYNTAMADYSIESIANSVVKPLVEKHLPKQKKEVKKILMVNILFKPISFGGATIVVEELAELVNANEEFELTIFTGFWDDKGHGILEYGLVRYESNSLPVIAVRYPPMTPELEYKNGNMEDVFSDVLKTLKPDIVHFHSIQQLSASLVLSAQKQHIPYIITLHDMWWLCQRQFMVMPNNKYCHQKKIDIEYCSNNCTDSKSFTHRRDYFLKPLLEEANLLLTPSLFQAKMYEYNNLKENVSVNKNGILFPAKDFAKIPSDKVRFAYLGGNAVHKGYNSIKEVFESIRSSDYELTIVDLHKKLGHNSIFADDWNIDATLSISAGYEHSQKGLDEFFSSVDVLVFPSQWKESFGLTIREALVRDVWVISTDAGGVVEDIVEGENGNIVAIGDNTGLKEKIEDMLKRKEFLDSYKNPHKTSIRSYKQQASELISYYDELLK